MRLTGVLYVVNGILDFTKEKSRSKPSEMGAFIMQCYGSKNKV